MFWFCWKHGYNQQWDGSISWFWRLVEMSMAYCKLSFVLKIIIWKGKHLMVEVTKISTKIAAQYKLLKTEWESMNKLHKNWGTLTRCLISLMIMSHQLQPSYQVRVITVFTVFRLLTDFVCLYNYEFWLSLCKIVRSSVILLLPLFSRMVVGRSMQGKFIQYCQCTT